jgi:hypothetical protein
MDGSKCGSFSAVVKLLLLKCLNVSYDVIISRRGGRNENLNLDILNRCS